MTQLLNLSTILTILIFSFVSVTSSAQLVDIGAPKSWSGKVPAKSNKQIVQMPGFDMVKVLAEDAANDLDKTKPWRFGHNYTVDLDLYNSGEWTELPNGDRIWRLTFRSSGAKSINVIFDDFYLPKSSSIHMYNKDRSHMVGAYTEILNNPDHTLGTELVMGEEVTIEYFEPKASKDQGRLHINTVTHGYRSLNLLAESILKGLNDSGACNIDVFCPLGNGWDDQIKSVGLIIVNGNSGCTGALINNTAGDTRPFFLTADHCLGNPANWFFRFNWHSLNPSCATTTPSGDGPFLQTAFTSTLRASSGGSDFALVELNSPLPADWDVYFAGWDRSDVIPNFTVGIHHPAGDIKKICRDDDPPTYSTFASAQVWRIEEWEHGVTEPGSSGSPLFDHNKRIIGQLFGGEAACSNTNPTMNNGRYDAYGRFASSWSGSNQTNQLSNWLDPLNTGVIFLDGLSNSSSGLDIDVALFNVGVPAPTICENPLILNPTVRNLGSTTITALTFEVQSDSETLLVYEWAGELLPATNLIIELPPITLEGGVNEMNLNILNPNGVDDENMENNSQDFSINLVENSIDAFLTLKTDCWGSETTIVIYDETGGELFSAGPFSDVIGGEEFEFEFCFPAGCYTFTIFDSFGDGINGSTYPSCSVDGDFSMFDADGNILFQMSAPNGDFEDEESHEFCLENSNLVADFTADVLSICEGGTVEFTDQSVGDIAIYEWEFPGGLPTVSTLQNPTVSYPGSGTYPVTLTISDGTSSATTTLENYIEVISGPDPSIEITNDFSCNGDCTGALDVRLTEGTEPYNFQWSTGDTSEVITDLCFTSSISVEVTDAVGCLGRDTIFIVAPGDFNAEVMVEVDCASQTACAELSIDDEENGPYNITWSTGEMDTTAICGLEVGFHSVIVSDQLGCSLEINFEVEQLDGPALIAITSLEQCKDDCTGIINIQAEGAEPFEYQWSNGGFDKSFQTELCAGDYRVTVTDDNGCENTLEVPLASGPDRPTASFEPSKLIVNLSVDPNISFLNQSQGATSFSWDFGDGGFSEDASPTYTYTEEGTYIIRLIAANGTCIDIDSMEITVMMSVNTSDHSLDQSMVLYPNPASMELYIDFTRMLTSGTVQLLNMGGNVVRHMQLDHTSQVIIQVAHLPAGMYLVRVLTNDEVVTKRVQIIR